MAIPEAQKGQKVTHNKRFFGPNNKRVKVPLGTRLRFNSLTVRQYGPNGEGSYGHVPKELLKVTVARRRRKHGLLVADGRFIPFSAIRDNPSAKVL